MSPFFYKEEAGAKGLAAPFPCTPNPHRNSSASLRTISLDDSEHLRHNHRVSVASLRLLFTFAPECRSTGCPGSRGFETRASKTYRVERASLVTCRRKFWGSQGRCTGPNQLCNADHR